ncbi:Spo0B C-terminal domain-containing protein [Alkalihalobacillus hemicellulosilyticus]|uniref:Sporulation initiation phosphotransferase B n=1 Tax=Halalkalibacter hemicellulosilyticusJCM 9152 TaxID=1236971 RepID=W4QGD7_9BACI|nr:Spo0B C-terminal domain-containing protein [Halalkalibacter hemicellulosilyticus]GAE30394.1 sporulation initiation phosphotransferase B [Halalkalibacter hemicellulosilyticusJCM 9152]
MEEKDVINALRHARHDWLNIIQLIKANVALKRYDRIEDIIEKATQQAFCESRLSSLYVTKVEYYLLTYHWNQHPVQLELEVVGEPFSLKHEEDRLFRLCQAVLEKLNDTCTEDAEHNVLISFLFNEKSCHITFDFHGVMKMNEDEWKTLAPFNLQVEEFHEHECLLSASFWKK